MIQVSGQSIRIKTSPCTFHIWAKSTSQSKTGPRHHQIYLRWRSEQFLKTNLMLIMLNKLSRLNKGKYWFYQITTRPFEVHTGNKWRWVLESSYIFWYFHKHPQLKVEYSNTIHWVKTILHHKSSFKRLRGRAKGFELEKVVKDKLEIAKRKWIIWNILIYSSVWDQNLVCRHF